MEEKQFIGRAFEGKFHDAEQTHINLLITGEDLNALIKLGKAAKQAQEEGWPSPPGTQIYEGKVQIKLEVKSSQSGKMYCAVNTYIAPEKESKPANKAEKKTGMELTDDDLPF
jgi:hypothetical protein